MRRLVTIVMLAAALVVVVAGLQLIQPSPFGNPMDGDRNVLAEGPGTGCSGCHSTAIPVVDYTDCTNCHDGVSAGLPPTTILGNTRYFTAHHSVPPNPSCPPEVDCTLSGSCQAAGCTSPSSCQIVDCKSLSCLDVACHNTGDARYVVRPVFDGSKATGHAYCGQCHDEVNAGQSCEKSLCHI